MAYEHKKIEEKWKKYWEENNIYKSYNPWDSKFEDKPKYYVLDMFPYPSWEWLHVWHPEWYTANDIIARYKKAKWYNVLHPMGWDAFGLPAENYAIKNWTHPRETTDKNINNFRKQIKNLWISYDWDREIDTTDPEYYKWTQWIFLKMFENWLAYEQDLPINYCPSCKTGLANEEVLNDFTCERCWTKVEKKKIRQWVLAITKYADRLLKDVDKLDWPESIKEMQRNWIWKSEWCEFEMKKAWDDSVSIKVYTTRIDTVFGMTYVVLAPDHKDIDKFITPKQKEACEKYIEDSKKKSDLDRTADNKEKTGVWTGSYVINPFNGKEVPLWIADYVLWNYWTWAVMAVPAHDERDFAFAQKYNLPIVQSIAPKDDKEVELPFTDYGILVNSWDFTWLTSQKAKNVLTEYTEKQGFGFKKINYKLRDWLFSRQRYWGEPIPLIHLKDEDLDKLTHISETDFEIMQKKIESYLNKKMRVVPPKKESVGPLANTTILSLVLDDIQKLKKIKRKRSKRFKLKHIFEEKKINWKTIRISGRYLIFHFNGKSWFERNKRLKFSQTIIENLDKAFFYENYAFLNISWHIWIVVFEQVEKDLYDIVTYYELKTFIKILNKAYILEKQNWDYLVIKWKVFSKIYDGIYGKIVCDYNLPLKLPEVKDFAPAWDWNSPLAKVENFVNVKLAENLTWKRETNTMPQWGWSCWYYLRYMDPKNDKQLVNKEIEKYWGQVDSYVWWAEHAVLHLLYARFWHKFLYDINVVSYDEPFYRLRNQGLITAYSYQNLKGKLISNDLVDGRDGKYFDKETWEELKQVIAKMSKSLKNVVNPDKIIEEYGADTLRLYEMYMADFKDSAPWNTKNIIWIVRFLDKIEKIFSDDTVKKAKDDKETIKLLHKTIKKVWDDIENYKFNTAIASLMILVNNWLPKDENLANEWKNIFLRLLHPFAPFLSEELWEKLWNNNSIFFSVWPEYDKKMLVDDTVKIAVQVLWKVRWTIEISKDENKESVLEKAKNEENVSKYLKGKTIKKEIYVPWKIVNFVV